MQVHTIGETSKILGLTVPQTRSLIRAGKLQMTNLAANRLGIPQEEIDRFKASGEWLAKKPIGRPRKENAPAAQWS